MKSDQTKGDVLFVTRHDASAIGGGSFMSCAFLQAFSLLYGERLTIIAPPQVRSIPLPKEPGRFVALPLRSLIQQAWWMITIRGIDRLSPFLDRWLEETDMKFSLAVIDTSRPGRFAPIFQRHGIPVVTIYYDVDVDYVRDNKKSAVWYPVGKYIVEKNERAAFTHSTLNLTLTPDDGSRLRELYPQPNKAMVKTIGCFERMHSAPLPRLPLQSRAANTRTCIVSTGSLCTDQTEDGIAWFISSILPDLKKILPNIQYTVAGRNPGSRISRLAKSNGVRLIANPPDMMPILDGADLYLSPIRMGSGIKLRLMDALRAGLPVVSHTVSARGFTGLIPDGMFATFNTEAECINAVQRMAGLFPLGLSARKKIQESYADQFTFNAGVERLRSLLRESLLEGVRPPRIDGVP